MKTALVIAISVLLIAPGAQAICNLNVRVVQPTTPGDPVKLQWDKIPGTVEYQIYETLVPSFDYTRSITTKTTFEIRHRVTAETRFRYIVAAIIDPSVASISAVTSEEESQAACIGTADAFIQPDEDLRRLTRKAILPVVGSAPGVNGARFKTSLRLIATSLSQRGRLIFHPAGHVASDQDPSIRYTFARPGETLSFEDVVAEIGASGIGSMDIVPDADSDAIVPSATVRLYNEAPTGTFGTFGEAVYPFNYLRPPVLVAEVPDSRFRLNLGFRTLARVHMRAFILGSTKGGLVGFIDRDYPADVMMLMSAEQLLGTKLQSGQVIELGFDGPAIPFHTITDNSTNDPTLIITTPRASTNVGAYVE